tara:strand:- start:74 stop:313 length:240 start_codon:yes stop_codon:yes gene_type:complete
MENDSSDMNSPLVGNRSQNYKFFYIASTAAIFSMFMLLIITGYTAYISTSANELITDMNKVINDINILLPDAKESLRNV